MRAPGQSTDDKWGQDRETIVVPRGSRTLVVPKIPMDMGLPPSMVVRGRVVIKAEEEAKTKIKVKEKEKMLGKKERGTVVKEAEEIKAAAKTKAMVETKETREKQRVRTLPAERVKALVATPNWKTSRSIQTRRK